MNDALVRLLSVTGTSRAAKRTLGLRTVSSGDGDLIIDNASPSSPSYATPSYGMNGQSAGSYGGFGYAGGGQGRGSPSSTAGSLSPISGANMRLRRKE